MPRKIRPILEKGNARISLETARSLLRYAPETGHLYWLEQRAGNAKVGSVAGCDNGQGYLTVSVKGRPYRAHRLAWFIFYGQWPEGEIDHVNRIRSDNRIANLRCAKPGQNQHNNGVYATNTSGLPGVRFKNGRFEAAITSGKKYRYLGRHDTAEEAYAAYLQAKAELHPFHAGYPESRRVLILEEGQ